MQCNSVSRFWPACRRKKPPPEPSDPNSRDPIVAPLSAPLVVSVFVLVLSLGGCAQAPQTPEPGSRPVPAEVELDPPAPVPQKSAAPAPPKPTCNWSRTKGVAEAVALNPDQVEFRFYPGDIRVAVPPGQRVESGEEFKAVLLRAQGCGQKLEVVDRVS